jgi:hypothetical protein
VHHLQQQTDNRSLPSRQSLDQLSEKQFRYLLIAWQTHGGERANGLSRQNRDPASTQNVLHGTKGAEVDSQTDIVFFNDWG